MKSPILGGAGYAGYVGSHLVRYAQEHRHDVPRHTDLTSIVQGA
jgi:nucleoside-diphosphate-sugar epimerase